ncbi:MAG: hypothetical protein QM662_09715 [Gordonia sp. (in: high G+C Gram-positive bacteria)]
MTLLDDTARGPRSGTAARSARGTGRRTPGARPNRSRAAQRALDRHNRRAGTEASTRGDRTAGSAPMRTRSSLTQGISRVPFVVPILLLLAAGLGLSLWLSTNAAEGSYELGVARQENQALTDRLNALRRTYDSGNSAPELADSAGRLGLIPANNPARMVIGADGHARIVGDPTPAAGTRMNSLNPETRPDPVSQIDPNGVDDSRGLSGAGQETATADPAGTTTTPTTSSTPAPAVTPGTAVASSPAADPDATPAPNVLPRTATAAPQTTSNAPDANPSSGG